MKAACNAKLAGCSCNGGGLWANGYGPVGSFSM